MLPYECLYPVPGLSVVGGAATPSRCSRHGFVTPPASRRSTLVAWARPARRWTGWRWRSSAGCIPLRDPRPGRAGGRAARPFAVLQRRQRWHWPAPARCTTRSRGATTWARTRRAGAAARVAVFACGRPDAAHTVATPDGDRAVVADGLARLADHSLLVVDRGEPTGYRAPRDDPPVRRGAAGGVRANCPAVQAPRSVVLGRADRAGCGATRRRLVRPVRSRGRRRQGRPRCAAQLIQTAALTSAPRSPSWPGSRSWAAFHRGKRRYEQAAHLEPDPTTRVEHLRAAVGVAGTRFAGTDMRRLLRQAADVALAR